MSHAAKAVCCGWRQCAASDSAGRRRLDQGLVGSAHLPVLPLQRLETLSLGIPKSLECSQNRGS